MSINAIAPTDTRAFFRPVVHHLVDLLRRLPADAWDRPTTAGAWRVRDIVAHLLDTSLRRLSFQRDRHTLPPPHPISSEADFVRFINTLNAEWISASRRISGPVMTSLYAAAGEELAEFFERLPLDAPALFPVSWAGDDGDVGWLDIGRELTEQWHHQMQIRDAVGAAPLPDPAWHRAVLLIAIRGLPHAYRGVAAASGTAVVVEIVGAAGGTFSLRRDGSRWHIFSGDAGDASARAILSDDSAWRLLFNGLAGDEMSTRVQVHGDADLVTPLLAARSVVV
jgi:uncharacterized protein (TIGR03083 family)